MEHMMKKKEMKKMSSMKPMNMETKQMTKIAHGSYNDTAMMAHQGASEFMRSAKGQYPDDNPFASEKQRRYMFAKHPKIAKKWAHEK